MPPAGYFCLQRQKYPKTPLETTFQDFLGALCPVPNPPCVPRAIGFSVYRCPSKGLCHHSFPLPLRCRCPLPRYPLSPLPPYRGTPHPNAADLVRTVIANQCSHWCGNPSPPSPRPQARHPFLPLPPAGYFCHQRQKYPKPPLETTFQDFLGALRPAANLPYVSRAIAFPVCHCPSKGLCHHSLPLPLRCRCPVPRQQLPPLPPYRGTPHPNATSLVRTVIPSQRSHWRGNPSL